MGQVSKFAGSNDRRRRVLNPKAALIVGFVAVCLLVGVRKLHDRQFGATRDFIRSGAMKALAAKDYRSAHSLMVQYLAMKPGDLEVKEQLSRILAERIGTFEALEKAFRLNEDLLRDNLPQHDLRLRHVRLALRLQRFSDADAHLKILRSAMAESAEVWYLSGHTMAAMRHPVEAMQFLERSLKCPNPVPAAFELMAELVHRESGDQARAEALIDQMVATVPSVSAYHIRASYRMKQQRVADAIVDLWLALESAPDNLQINALLVQCLQQQAVNGGSSDELPRAESHFRALATQHPEQPMHVISLAMILWHRHSRSEAFAVLESGIRNQPRAFAIHRTLIEYRLSNDEASRAREIFDQIPAGAISRGEYEFLMGRLLMAERNWDDAELALSRSLAFSPDGSALLSRIQLSLAICRRQIGHGAASLSAYREVIAQDPNSTTGRLGVAAAHLEANQIELAIAEYQQLLDVPGVPAYLANLMIQHNLQQPGSLRQWDAIERLIREDHPLIADPAERVLLRADLRLAQGEVVESLTLLEDAARIHPDRVEIARAIRKLNGEHGAAIRVRLEQLVQTDPENIEAHAAIVRMWLRQNDTFAATQWLENIVAGKQCPTLSENRRLQVAMEAARLTDQLEQRALRPDHHSLLQTLTLKHADQLTSLAPEFFPTLMQELVQQNKSSEALRRLTQINTSITDELRALGCLQFIRYSPNMSDSHQVIWTTLLSLIQRDPSNSKLRLVYAESMLYAGHYDIAEQTLNQILQADSRNPVALARTAWILAKRGQSDDALRMSDTAVALDPQNLLVQLASIRVRLAAHHFDECVTLLKELVVREPANATVRAYLAIALSHLDRMDEAQSDAQMAISLSHDDPLLPADLELLEPVLASIADTTTVAR